MFRHLKWRRNQVEQRRRFAYAAEHKTPHAFDLYKWLTQVRRLNKRDAQWGAQFQRSALKRMRLGRQNFVSDRKGPPRFRRVRSCATKPCRNCVCTTMQIKGVGELRSEDQRGVHSTGGEVKLVRIVQTPLGSGYNVRLVMQLPDELHQTATRAPNGIDLGVKAVCTLSNGAQHAPIRLDDTKRQRAQRRLSQGGSARRKKKNAVAKTSRRVAARRTGAAHRITSSISKDHSAYIVLEDLKLKNMTARGGSSKRGLNRAILAQSLSEISNQLAYKAERAGGKLVKVSPHYTTQTCSACSGRPKESIGWQVRTYPCAWCGVAEDRDVNAAKNIRAKGLDLLGRPGLQPACCTEAAQGGPLGLAAEWTAPKPPYNTGSQGIFNHSV